MWVVKLDVDEETYRRLVESAEGAHHTHWDMPTTLTSSTTLNTTGVS